MLQAVQNTVFSYEELESVLAEGMRKRKSSITIYFDPHRTSEELQQWNHDFWGGASAPDDSQFFHKIPWLYWAWTGLDWNWIYDVQGLVSKIIYQITYYYGSDKEDALEDGLLTTEWQIISPDMDMVTREKTIHDWIVTHVDYDEATVTNDDDMGYTDYSAFFRGLAVCNSYSTLTNRMLSMAGISNLYVYGTVEKGGRLLPHGWNMVDLNNDWYQLDVTWDDPGVYGDNTVYYKYFNLSDDQISADHSWNKNIYPKALQTFHKSRYQGQIDHECSIFEPGLCKNEIDCININGRWNGNYCTSDPRPPDSMGSQCRETQSCLSFDALNCASLTDCRENNFFHVNDTVQIRICMNAQQSNALDKVDLYAGIIGPGGNLFFLTSNPVKPIIVWNGGAVASDLAYKTEIEQTNRCFTILNIMVPSDLKGTYDFYAVLLRAGKALDSSSLLSNLAYKRITLGD